MVAIERIDCTLLYCTVLYYAVMHGSTMSIALKEQIQIPATNRLFHISMADVQSLTPSHHQSSDPNT